MMYTLIYRNILTWTNNGTILNRICIRGQSSTFCIKQKPLSDGELISLQMKIEDLTMRFDEESMFKTAPNIIRILIKNNDLSAKEG
jgi:hypothetical protein